jgi:hypothetical protein
MRTELEVANLVLHLLDWLTDRSYGSTCCDLSVGRGLMEESLEPLLTEMFVAARGSLTNQIVYPGNDHNLFNIGCIHADGYSLKELKDLVEKARTSGGWAVLMIHGIGTGTHDLYLDIEVHKRFIGWLAKQHTIWVAPVRTIAYYIKQYNQPLSTQ